MQTFEFTKMQGAGNDYVYVNCMNKMLSDINETAKKISDRHFGIGSDGLVLICPSDKADFRMAMYNSDGTQAQMCGNASRCIGKFVHDKGLTDKTVVTLETLAGIKTLQLNLDENNRVKSVCVNMGAPEFEAKKIPAVSADKDFTKKKMTVLGKEYEVTAVSMGNPHAVTFVDDVDAIEIEKVGPLFENNKLFPERINTEFVQIIDSHTLKMRVWERGAGETLACGTGACAVMAVSDKLGVVSGSADILLRGGKLHIEWNKTENNIYMTGPAEFVYDGIITV